MQDLDGFFLLRLDFLDLLVRDDDVFFLVVLEAFDDVFRLDLLAAVCACFFITDAAVVFFMQLVEMDVVVLGGRIHRDRDRDHAECYDRLARYHC
ncbi:hypothetical protein SDC9_170986 [bioreactor metagenome]|uniref:Uncharacterized protein n=1 Tax=bioreactor metagenome TaxID=1076179 RepID=A0A645GIA4_9ZZZZ